MHKCDCPPSAQRHSRRGKEIIRVDQSQTGPVISDSDGLGPALNRPETYSQSAAIAFSFNTHTGAASPSPLHDPLLLSSIYVPEKPYLPYSQKNFVQTPFKEVS